MKRLAAFLLLLTTGAPLAALPPVPPRNPPPGPAPIVIPDVKPPTPPPPPVSVAKLGPNVWWVAQSTADFSVVPSPEGLVTVTKVRGPVTMRGWFVEAPNVVQTKTFAGPYVVTVEAAGTGKCELLIGTDVNALKRVCLDVYTDPVPPGPGPGPGPDPPPPSDPLTKAFQDAYNQDKDADRAKSLAFLQAAYAAMANAALTRTEKTNAAFVAWMKTVVEAPGVGLTQPQVKNLRTAIGQELSRAWGGTVLTPLTPANAAAELGVVAKALAGVR